MADLVQIILRVIYLVSNTFRQPDCQQRLPKCLNLPPPVLNQTSCMSGKHLSSITGKNMFLGPQKHQSLQYRPLYKQTTPPYRRFQRLLSHLFHKPDKCLRFADFHDKRKPFTSKQNKLTRQLQLCRYFNNLINI